MHELECVPTLNHGEYQHPNIVGQTGQPMESESGRFEQPRSVVAGRPHAVKEDPGHTMLYTGSGTTYQQ